MQQNGASGHLKLVFCFVALTGR